MAVDPITLAVLQGSLEQIADEMDATLERMAFPRSSPTVGIARAGFTILTAVRSSSKGHVASRTSSM